MYKLEAHLHTKGNSDCAKVASQEIATLYSGKGYNGIVCTNHFSRFILNKYFKDKSREDKLKAFLKGYYDLKSACQEKGIDVSDKENLRHWIKELEQLKADGKFYPPEN